MESDKPQRKKRGRPRKHPAPAAQAPAEPAMTLQQALMTATPRQLIHALVNRLQRTQTLIGKKVPPAVFLQQELREAVKGFDNHPILDEDRP